MLSYERLELDEIDLLMPPDWIAQRGEPATAIRCRVRSADQSDKHVGLLALGR
jgi:hypothetical protein